MFAASRFKESGSLVTTGTLTQAAPGKLVFDYADTPTGRLRVVLADGTTTESFVSALDGDFTGGSTDFLNGEHELVVRVMVPGTLDVRFSSQQSRRSPIAFDGTRRAGAEGTIVHEGETYTTDVDEDGTYAFQIDQTGCELRRESRYTGTITRAGFRQDVDKSWFYESVGSSDQTTDIARRASEP